MPIYQVKNQWGGSSAPWHEGGMWDIGDRSEQNLDSLDGEKFSRNITILSHK